MRWMLILAFLAAPSILAQVPPGHHLPEGPERIVREREIDIQRVTADLRFDMDREEISGIVTIAFAPLRSGLKEFFLDAADLKIGRVETTSGATLVFALMERKLRITLPRALGANQEATVRIIYSCRPKAGMYFFPALEKGSAQAWNFGEGGLHYGWLPLYNDTNDRFAVEFLLTVARPYVAVSNGTLRETRENPDGTRTFHWIQKEEIPNYLLTVNVGEFVQVPLDSARVGSRSIPLSVWAPPGHEDAAAFTFKDTPKMVEFFSQRFGYAYPWTKYDQIILRDFSVGAMETTTMVGFSEAHQHRAGDPPDSGPSFDQAHPIWVYEDTIAHELAHHWFGDLVTCRSLASIWLNESFATFAHTIWNGHAHGEDDLTYQRWRYLNNYLDFVRKTGTVRPMEYFRYAASEGMYQTEITYIKGSLILHMLRHFVGDEDFFRTIADYLTTHEFGTVESVDLLEAFRRTTGQNLSWFFNDWITNGAGRPSFEISYRWVPERRQVDLTVRQVQADLPFENDFRLPVDIEVVTEGGPQLHRVQVEGWLTQVSIPAESRPLTVVFDKGNWLVGEVRYERPLREVLYQLEHGGLADQLRAARQIATDFPRRKRGVDSLTRLLADSGSHWGLRQEAALDLGSIGGAAATEALVKALADSDRRVRRAAALAVGEAGGQQSAAALRKTIETDPAEDVVAVATVAFGRLHTPDAAQFLKKQLDRDSRWYGAIRIGTLQGLAELEDPALIPNFKSYTDPRWRREVRLVALDGWFRAAPGNAELASRLRELAEDRNQQVRSEALEKLGELHRSQDLPFLEEFASAETNPNLAEAARAAAVEIKAFAKAAAR